MEKKITPVNHHEQVLQVLNERFPEEKDLIGIEVGTNTGLLTVTLLREIPRIKMLYTIDPWRHFDGEGFEAGNDQDYHDRQKKEAMWRLKTYLDRISFMQMTSDEAFPIIEELAKKVHFVWIDGHHAYKQVRKDIINATKVLVPGGLLGGHDYNLTDDVRKAVHELLGEETIETGVDFTWWKKRK